MKHILITITAFISIINCSCSDNSAESPPKIEQDTTSHNFIWRIDTLGKYPSYFNDVTVFDEDNIWAVGEITTDSGTFNLAKWNGKKWHLQDIDLKQPVNGVFNFDLENVWAASGVLHYWDGINWAKYNLWNMNVLDDSDGSLTAVWGNSKSNIYFAGNLGTIVHFNGTTFQKMESNTNIRLRRISGNDNGNVFVTGYEDNGQGIVLELKNNSWEGKYVTNGIPNPQNNDIGIVSSVWCGNNYAYFTTLSGLLKLNLKTNEEIISSDHEENVYPFAEHDIEGQAENDIVIISNRGKVVHWNGNSWSLQNEIYDQYPDHILTTYGADYNFETVAYVGPYQFGAKAFIVIGRHN